MIIETREAANTPDSARAAMFRATGALLRGVRPFHLRSVRVDDLHFFVNQSSTWWLQREEL